MAWIHWGHQGKSLSEVHLKMSQNATETLLVTGNGTRMCQSGHALVPLGKRGKASVGATWQKGKVAWRCEQQSPDCAGPSRSW